MKCPLCGSKVTYQGISTIECQGVGCSNGPSISVPPGWTQFSYSYYGYGYGFQRDGWRKAAGGLESIVVIQTYSTPPAVEFRYGGGPEGGVVELVLVSTLDEAFAAAERMLP